MRSLWLSPSKSSPSVKPTKPNAKSKKPVQSNLFALPLWFPITLAAAQKPNMPIGILIKKIQCHEVCTTSQPPKIGPRIGPMSPAVAIKFQALINWFFGTVWIIARRATGIINAPPIPWIIRASTRVSREIDIAQATEPNTKVKTAERKTVSVPNLAAAQAVKGINKATARE